MPLLVALGLARPGAAQTPRVAVRYAPLANLTYQLDCVGGAPISCSAESYRALWAREFLRSAADSAALTRWRQVRARAEEPVAEAPVTEAASASGLAARRATRPDANGPPPDRADAIDRQDPVRLAGLHAGDTVRYAALLDSVGARDARLSADDRAALVAVVRHFTPAFAQWWARVAGPEGAPFAAHMAALLAEPRVTGQLTRYVRFYGAQLAAADTLAFVLLYRPASATGGTRGQQLGRDAIVEFLAGEAPAARLDVVVHELCHYLYQRAPRPAAGALYARFLASPRATAVPAYNLLDEVLASALGNGLMARSRLVPAAFDALLARSGALYVWAPVDRGAKAVLPWLGRWIAAGRMLHESGFAPAYVDRLARGLGPALDAPAVYLNRMVLVVDTTLGGGPDGGGTEGAVRRAFRIGSYVGGTQACCAAPALAEYRARPRMSALLIVAPDHLPGLVAGGALAAADLPRIEDRLASTNAIMFTARRALGAYTFLVVARDAAGVGPELARLAQRPAPVLGTDPAGP